MKIDTKDSKILVILQITKKHSHPIRVHHIAEEIYIHFFPHTHNHTFLVEGGCIGKKFITCKRSYGDLQLGRVHHELKRDQYMAALGQ